MDASAEAQKEQLQQFQYSPIFDFCAVLITGSITAKLIRGGRAFCFRGVCAGEFILTSLTERNLKFEHWHVHISKLVNWVTWENPWQYIRGAFKAEASHRFDPCGPSKQEPLVHSQILPSDLFV